MPIHSQFYLGAIAATFSLLHLDGLPAVIVVPASLIAAMSAGALWALWPAVLRIKSGTDEVITTLMGNFIAGLLLLYVTAGPLKDAYGTGEVAASRPIDAAYRLSGSSGLSAPIVAIAIAVGVLAWLLLNRTRFGVLSGLVGRNAEMVRWQGAKVVQIGFAGFVLSGALAGLAGAVEIMGANGRLVSGFLPAHGLTAILVALVADLSIIGAGLSALFFGGLAAASLYLPVLVGLPAAAIDIINAMVALFITARAWPGRALRVTWSTISSRTEGEQK